MSEHVQAVMEHNSELEQLGNLTRRELKELEEKEKTPVQKVEEALIMALPAVCGVAALSEYLLIPDLARNKNPMYYVYVLAAMMAAYLCAGLFAAFKRRRGNKVYYEKLRYGAPRLSALFLLLALYDYLTLKTGTLTQPFVPCMNFIINAFVSDYPMLIECTMHTLRLLMIGYVIGVSLGLVTGITCGYSRRVRYWVDPVI